MTTELTINSEGGPSRLHGRHRGVNMTLASALIGGTMLLLVDSNVLNSWARTTGASIKWNTLVSENISTMKGLSNLTTNEYDTTTPILSSGPPSHCWLSPPWGTNFTITNSTGKRVCATRFGQGTDVLVRPYSTASTLACPKDDILSIPEADIEVTERITIILLYYSNPAVLMQQLEHFANFSDLLQAKIELLVVDDGSPPGLQAQEYAFPPVLATNSTMTTSSSGSGLWSRLKAPVRIVRVLENLIWNIPGAQNLGVHVARTSKILLLDLDSFVSVATLERLFTLPLSSEQYQHIAYRFFLSKYNSGEDASHNKITFLQKATYWAAGGYDEDFVGHYGHDDYAFWFRFKMNRHAYFDKVVSNISDRLYVYYKDNPPPCSLFHQNDNEDDSSRQRRQCETALESLPHPPKREDIPINRKLFFRRKFTQCWSNKYLRFDWTTDMDRA